MSKLINPLAPPLSQPEMENAVQELYTHIKFPRVIRTKCDPQIAGQQYGQFSFIPSPTAVPDNNGNYGIIKLRGNFAHDQDAKFNAAKLIREHDSYHPIYTIPVGTFCPLGKGLNSTKDEDIIAMNEETAEILDKIVMKQKESEERAIKEVNEQQQKLYEEEKNPPTDPLTAYIELRTIFATLKITYDEHVKKIGEVSQLLAKRFKQIKDIDDKEPSFKTKHYEKYLEAYSRAGLDKSQMGADTVQNSYLRYIAEDIELPKHLLGESASDKLRND